MAKKELKKDLVERINAMIKLTGEKLAEAKLRPAIGKIRAELYTCLALTKGLEDRSLIRDAEAKITVLEATLAKSSADLEKANLESGNLEAELKVFRAERKEQETKEREIDPIQFQILERLGSPASCEWLNLGEIARALKIRVDEAEIYVEGLEKKLGLIFFHPHEPGGGGWLRTAEGNKLVVAKRWAGEESQKAAHKHADLPALQQQILLAILRSPMRASEEYGGAPESEISSVINKSLEKTQLELRRLRAAEMATDGDEPQATYCVPGATLWSLMEKGWAYLDKRDLL